MPLDPPVNHTDHLLGDDTARVTLVHYGDFECPFSGAAYLAIRAVLAQFSGSLCYVFRPFPLSDIHPHALRAAEAAEAAAAQGQFWPMYDLLFQHQDALEDVHLVGYASKLNLDVERFALDLQERRHLERLRESLAQGRAIGVRGTPTLFVNGVLHENREQLWNATRLTRVIEDALNPP